jgi:hypothetical protein
MPVGGSALTSINPWTSEKGPAERHAGDQIGSQKPSTEVIVHTFERIEKIGNNGRYSTWSPFAAITPSLQFNVDQKHFDLLQPGREEKGVGRQRAL